MAATLAHIEKMKKKFKNVEIKVVEKSEDGTKAEIFAITYQKNGLPGKFSTSLMEANDIWGKNRPSGYYIAHGFDKGNGVNVSVMATEEWIDKNKVSAIIPDWEKSL